MTDARGGLDAADLLPSARLMKCDRAVFLPQSEMTALRAEAEATRVGDEERRLENNLLPPPIPKQKIRGLTGYRIPVTDGQKIAVGAESNPGSTSPRRE